MNDDRLAKNLSMNYDALSENFVVTTDPPDPSTYPGRDERLAPRPAYEKKEPAKKQSLFGRLFQQPPNFGRRNAFPPPRPPAPPWQPYPPTPPRPPYPSQTPNPAVRLAREIYVELDMLTGAYKDLREIDERDSATLKNLESQAAIMRATMGNIYRTLSGSPRLPLCEKKLELNENYCKSLDITADFVSQINGKILRLMRLVAIASIDRQLLILNATLSAQERTVRDLYSKCVRREQNG